MMAECGKCGYEQFIDRYPDYDGETLHKCKKCQKSFIIT